jgi:hypothetical protein
MKKMRFVWLWMIGIGLLFVGATLVSSAENMPAADHSVLAQAEDDCPPNGTVAASVSDGDADLPSAQTGENPCLDCHTNAERLKELAVEEEKVSLSEGPG